MPEGKRSTKASDPCTLPPRRAGGVPEGKRSASKQSVGARGVPVGVPEGKQSHRQAIRVACGVVRQPCAFCWRLRDR